MKMAMEDRWDELVEEYGRQVTGLWVVQVFDVWNGDADPESLDWPEFLRDVDVREPDFDDFLRDEDEAAREREDNLRGW